MSSASVAMNAPPDGSHPEHSAWRTAFRLCTPAEASGCEMRSRHTAIEHHWRASAHKSLALTVTLSSELPTAAKRWSCSETTKPTMYPSVKLDIPSGIPDFSAKEHGLEKRRYDHPSIHAARSPRSLTERRITHIISVCSDAIPAEIPESGIVHMRIPVEDVDFADLLIWFPTACQFIEQAIAAEGVVLVHCNQGLTRSATVVAAYLMRTRRIDATQAMLAVRQAREQVWFNAGFHEQLVLFELCRYQPSPACPYYVGWRKKVDANLAGQA